MSDQGPPDLSVLRELAARIGSRARDRATARALSGETGQEPEGTESPVGPPEQGVEEALLRGLSLLWPAGSEGAGTVTVPEQTAVDLELAYLVTQIAPKRRFAPELDRILRSPLTDESTIRYRQEIVADILGCPEPASCCRTLAEQAVASSESFRLAREDRPRLFLVATRLAELQDFVDTVDALLGALRKAAGLRSQGLTLLRSRLEEIARSGWYSSLRGTVGRLLADIRGIRSVTVSINLDPELRPVEATLLSINRSRFLESRVFPGVGRRGIVELHSMLAQPPRTAMPIAAPLFRDLASILDQLGRLMELELARFSEESVRFTTSLKQELVFYASAVSLVERLREAGLPSCAPAIRPPGDRTTVLRGLYNVNLAFRVLERGADLRSAMVASDADFSDPLRMAVLTGPNNGGKSVYLQAVGLAQLLAQSGMHVPAAKSELAVADTIATHYQIEERPDKEVGRLHEETERLRGVLSTVTRNSLFLSSETFSSTGSAEATYLLADVIRALQKLGCRAVFSTHLHELAEAVERDPAFRSGETHVGNLVALFEGNLKTEDPAASGRPTYRIVQASPAGRSYAQIVARKLGIGYDQLVQSMERSGRLPQGET